MPGGKVLHTEKMPSPTEGTVDSNDFKEYLQ